MRIDEVAARLDAAGTALTDAGATLAAVDPGPRVFGADAGGRLGELGRALHGQCASALGARAREAVAHGARLTDAAQVVRGIGGRYTDADRAARERHDIEGP